MSRPRRRRPAASSTRETIQPPGTGRLVVWMVTVTLLVAVVGSLANSGMARAGLLVFLPAAAAAQCTVRQTALVCAWTALLGSAAFLTGGGDVARKGLAAVGAAFAVLGSFREAAHREPTLTGLVDALDASVVRHNSYVARRGDDERFVTVLILNIDDARNEVQAINCGHVPPHLLDADSVITPPLDSGAPLGLAALAAEPATPGRFAFPGGTALLLTTDGLTESRAADGAFYPLDERLADPGDLPRSDLPRALNEDAHAYAGKAAPHDDVAILTVRRPHRSCTLS
ncbi:PP2C family protein-serine/threonine phosphatase [Streptomyces lividans]|nr:MULTISPECIES: PP2C family protein-serine/threonine phosphatase [Streptomyces]KKD11242.1 hypothetical protein TR66_32200 [Streptomyces sp. WM6391]